MRATAKGIIGVEASVIGHDHPSLRARIGSRYDFECLSPCGEVKWRDSARNIVVDQGLNHMLAVISMSGFVTAGGWYVGLIATGQTVVAGDLATNFAFTSLPTIFSEATLPSFSAGSIATAAQTISNTSNKASFSIVTGVNIGGAYMISSNVKAGATNGSTLFGGATLAAQRVLASGDTLNVTITVGTEVT